MARLDDLEFVITANASALRNELSKGSDAVNAFASKTEAALSHHNTTLEHLSRTTRRVFELYGAFRAFDAFKGWLESATQIDKLTQSQADQLAGMKEQVEGLASAWDHVAQALATKLAPMLEKSAGFWKQVAESAAQSISPDRLHQIANIQDQINAKAKGIFDLQSGKSAPMRGTTDQAIARIRGEIDKLVESMKALQNVSEDADKTIGQLDWEKKVSGLQDVIVSGKRTTAEEMFSRPGTEMLARAAQLAEQLKTPLEKDLETLREIRQLADYLPANAVSSFADQKLQEFDLSQITSKFEEFKPALSDADKEMKKFGDATVAALESRGIDALVNGDISGAVKGLAQDFATLIIKMELLQPLADKLRQSMKGLGSGGSLADLVVGSIGGGTGNNANPTYPGAGNPDLFPGFASGGRPNVGEPAWFGEDGPELWVPDVAGRVLSNAESRSAMGGTNVYLTQNIQAGLPPQWDVQLVGATRIAAIAATEAATKHFGGRR